MTQFLIRRIFWAIFLFLVATIITYLIFWVIPSDPARARSRQVGDAGRHRARQPLPPSRRADLEAVPPLRVAARAATARSAVVRQPAARRYDHRQGRARHRLTRVRRRDPLAVPLDPDRDPLRAAAALDHGPHHDDASFSIGISAHPVWLGLIFSYVFGYKLGLTPIAGYCNFFPGTIGAQCEGPVNWAYHLILPWCTFMILYAALYVRLSART